MNPNYTKLIFLLALVFFPTLVFSQVGINTTSPRKTLEVGGTMEISDNIDIGTYNSLTDADTSTFLIQSPSGSIKSLDVSNPTSTALGYIQEYEIVNPELDWILDFNTGISSKDFVLITISAYYNKELVLSTSNDAPDHTSMPYTSTFIKGNTWHIIADYPVAANIDHSEVGTWTITTLIFSKDLSKQFGTIEIPMANTTVGSAITPIID